MVTCSVSFVLYDSRHKHICVGSARESLVLMVLECGEQGSRCTLYAHGLIHVWDMPPLPIQASDESGEAALSLAKHFAECIATQPDESMIDTL